MQSGALQQLPVADTGCRQHSVVHGIFAPAMQKVRHTDGLSRGSSVRLVDTQNRVLPLQLLPHSVNQRGHGLTRTPSSGSRSHVAPSDSVTPPSLSTPFTFTRLSASVPRVQANTVPAASVHAVAKSRGTPYSPVSSQCVAGTQKLVFVNTSSTTFKAPQGHSLFQLHPAASGAQLRVTQMADQSSFSAVKPAATESRLTLRGKKNARSQQVNVPVAPSGDRKRVRVSSHVEPRRLKLVGMALNGSVDLSHGVLFLPDDVDQLDITASTTFSEPPHATTALQVSTGKPDQSLPSPTLPSTSRYKTELCRSFEEQGTCKYGEKCQFAHGRDELRHVSRHPKYKTEYCRTYHASGFCPYGQRCHFVHDERSIDTTVASQPALTAVYAGTDSAHVSVPQHTVPVTSANFEDALAGAVEQLTASYTSMTTTQRNLISLEALRNDPLNEALLSALACSTPVTPCASGTYDWNCDCAAVSVSVSTSTSDDSGVLLPDKAAVCATRSGTQLSAEQAQLQTTSVESALRESDGESEGQSSTADVAWFDGALNRLALDENNNVVDENGDLANNWMVLAATVAARQVADVPTQHVHSMHESAFDVSPDVTSPEKRLPIFEALAAAR